MHCNKTGKNHPERTKERRMIPILQSGIMVYVYQANLSDFWFGFAAWNSEIVPSNDFPLEAIPTDPSHQAKPLGDFEWWIWPISESWNGRIWTGFVRTLHPLLDMSWSLSSASCNMLVHFMFLGPKEVCFSCTMFLHAFLLHVACFEDHRCSR